MQLIEVEVDDRLPLVRQPRSFEVGRQVIEPSAVFVLQIDQRRDGCRPPPQPWRDASRRWWGALCSPPVTAWRGVAPAVRQGSSVRNRLRRLGNAHLSLSIVTVRFPGKLRRSVRSGRGGQFLCSIESRFSVPTWVLRGRRAQPRSGLAEGHRRRRARSGLDGGEHGARLGRVGGSARLARRDDQRIGKDDPRRARHWGASSRRKLVCGRSVRILTMMQSCASAAKLRAAGPFSPSASVPCLLPVPATSDRQSAVRPERQRERRVLSG